ncbi:MAG TPA: YihY/virulence factor BrkB family protein [Nannocystaceae bacterium]|nr:YihY/virulence factor BrkB family protein [Nannocystaceae bacterium]
MIRSDAAPMPTHAHPDHGRRAGARAIIEVPKTTFKRFFAARADILSGAMAYFTVLSLAPLLILAIAIVGLVYGEEAARQRVVEDLSTSMGPHAAGVLDDLLRAAAVSGNGWKLAIGIGVALWGASKIFTRLQDALNDIWGVRARRLRDLGDRTMVVLRKRASGFVAALLVGVLLLASMTLKSVIAGVHGVTGALPFGTVIWPVVEGVGSVVLITAFIALVYKWLPDVELELADVWPGALLTSLLVAVGSFAISAYLGYLATTSLSGAAGGVLVLLLWIYFTSQVFLFGAEFTRAYTEWRRGPARPEAHAEAVARCEDSPQISESDRR